MSFDKRDYLAIARAVLEHESASVHGLLRYLDESFEAAVETLLTMEGRAIFTGVGKSALIAKKLVATFNSTGTPALFMHAADAIHGDLGMVQRGDVVIALSKSGTTQELTALIPFIREQGNTIIAIVSDAESDLARMSNLVLRATVNREAWPGVLAPTSSTTAQLALGDALAICLIEAKGFTTLDFAKCHPGGSLGKKLYMKVKDVIAQDRRPAVQPTSSLESVIVSISSNRLGATAVLNTEEKVIGIITDGDLRRMLERTHDIRGIVARDIMTESPRCIQQEALAVDAFSRMEKAKITQLIVLDGVEYQGMVHIHDLLKEGLRE